MTECKYPGVFDTHILIELVFVKLRGAVRAAGCLDADLRLAIRTGLRRSRRRSLLLAKRMESLDEQEQDESLNDEVNEAGNKLSVWEHSAEHGKAQVVKLCSSGKQT